MAEPQASPVSVEKSLQINITSVADARACIRHLQKIKADYTAYGCTSIELCVYSGLENDMQVKDLSQNFRWCKTYRKIVQPFPGNVLFALPHFDEVAQARISELSVNLKGMQDAQAKLTTMASTVPQKRSPGRPRLEPVAP